MTKPNLLRTLIRQAIAEHTCRSCEDDDIDETADAVVAVLNQILGIDEPNQLEQDYERLREENSALRCRLDDAASATPMLDPNLGGY